MGKNSSPPQQTVVNKTELPAWMSQGGEDIFNKTRAAADAMPGPYMGNTVAGPSGDTNAAYDMTRNNIGSTNGMYDAAQGAVGGVSGYQPQQVQGQSFLNGNVNAYMNPFTQNVIDTSMADMDKQRLRSLNGVGASAAAAGAFGGSRQGVMEGVTNAETADAAGRLSASLHAQGYDNATGLMQQDMNRAQQANLANQTAGLQGANLRLQGGLGLGTLAGQRQQSGFADAAALQAIGQGEEGYSQRLLDQQRNQYEAQRNAPFDQLSKPLTALGMIPHDSTSTSTGPGPQQPNPWMQAAGFGLSALATFGKFASDERIKTNIEPLGKDPQSGLPLYAYDYKADVAAAKKSGSPMPPKRVGPMAQDIEAAGGPVSEIGGKKVVGAMSLSGKRR